MGRINENRNMSPEEKANRDALLAARVRKGFHKLFPFAHGETVCLNGSAGSYQGISATSDSITIHTYTEGSRENAWDIDHVVIINSNPIAITLRCEERPQVEKHEPIKQREPRRIYGDYNSWGTVSNSDW